MKTSNRVIITGGTGLVGRNLALELASGGYEVVVLSRSPEKHRAEMPPGVRIEGWDGRSVTGWGNLVEGAAAIVNLAGANLSGGRWSASRKRILRDSRVNPGTAVVEAVRLARQRPAVVIQASAVGYYGPHGDEMLTESAPPGSDYLSRLTLDWEASTREVETLGVRWVVVRSGIVLDHTEGALPRMALPFRLFFGGPVGGGRQWVSWIHPKDESAALRFLIEHPELHGAFNLTSPQPVTNREFGRAIARALIRPAWVPAPGFAVKLLFGEMSTVVLTGQRVQPERLLQAAFQFRFPAPVEALKDVLR